MTKLSIGYIKAKTARITIHFKFKKKKNIIRNPRKNPIVSKI